MPLFSALWKNYALKIKIKDMSDERPKEIPDFTQKVFALSLSSVERNTDVTPPPAGCLSEGIFFQKAFSYRIQKPTKLFFHQCGQGEIPFMCYPP